MPSPRPAILLVASLAVTFALGPDALGAPKRKVIDGIAAIVDRECITRSELARHMAPLERRLDAELRGKPAEREIARARLREEALQALVDRRLFALQASRMHVQATDEEVDQALGIVAQQNAMRVPELLAAAEEQGYPEKSYRIEIKHQILEGKVLQLDTPPRFPDWKDLSPEARSERMAKARVALLAELRARTFVAVRP